MITVLEKKICYTKAFYRKTVFYNNVFFMTGLVDNPTAGMYLMQQWPDLPEGKVLDFPTKLTVKTALALFDYVMDTAETQAA